MIPPTSIDGTDITGATIDGQDVQEITVDGQTVFTAVVDNIILDDFADNVLTGRDTTVAKEINESAEIFRPEWTVLSAGGTADVSNSTYRAYYDGDNDTKLVGVTIDTGKGDGDFSNTKVNFTMINYDDPGTAQQNNTNRMIITPSQFVDGDLQNSGDGFQNSVFFYDNKALGLHRLTVYVNGTRYRNNVSGPSSNQDITVQLDYTVSPARARLFYDSTEIVSEPEIPTLNDMYWFIGGTDTGPASGLGGVHLETDAVKMFDPTI